MQTKIIQRKVWALLALVLWGALTLIRPVDAQDASSQKLDVYVSESKIIYLTKPVDDVTVSAPDVLTVEKVRGMDSQISMTGASVGDAVVTVKMGATSQSYSVRVSPMPQRIYINIPESKYLSFKNRVDDFNLSVAGVVRVLQPTEKEILLEALPRSAVGGRTTLTVYSKGEIYRYYVSTFENRGADLLEIQNAFTSRGYKSLVVKFENDQATISGGVTTQEELDDAVRIVKQFTPYVQIKAAVGSFAMGGEETEDERVIVNNIQRIAQVKGLIVKVKFGLPQETIHSTYTRVAGSPALTQSVTDNQTRLTTTNTILPQDNGGATKKNADEGTIETVDRVENKKVPEKIFLFGELANDLDEAKAIRVARTYCPLIVSMVTVKDPIQLRLKTRVLTVDLEKMVDVGILWGDPNGATTANPTGGIVIGGNLNYNPASGPVSPQRVLQDLVKNLETSINYSIHLGETNNFIKQVQTIDIMLTNGQPASIFRGENIPYPSSQTIDTSGFITTSASYVSTGLRVIVVPLNYERASQFAGEELSLQNPDGTTIIGSVSKYYQLNKTIGDQGALPVIDESLKYVDENGLIGLSVLTSVSALVEFDSIGNNITAPRTESKTSMARAHLREGRTLVMGGILDDSLKKVIRSVPGFNKIPIFGFLFDNPYTDHPTQEMILTFTPELVHLGEPDSKQVPKPALPEMMDLMQKEKIIPSIKPVRYDARGVDLRPDTFTMPRSAEVKPEIINLNTEPSPAPAPVVVEPVAPVITTTDLKTIEAPTQAPPPAPEVAPISDTADLPQQPAPAPAPAPTPAPVPTLAPAPAEQPNVDTAAPSVNNPPPNPADTPVTLP